MQVDSERASQSAQFINYFDTSNNFAWRETRLTEIEKRRALLGDALIFDVLLLHGGIKQPDALYPPPDDSALQRLLDAIEASLYDTLKKECLVYYLLKWHQDGREGRFQLDRCIPPHFAALADAYWLLDTGASVPLAVSLLSDARLNQEYVSKILQAISLASNPALIVKYVRTARPELTEPCDLELYVIALAECCGLCDAWEYQRSFSQTSTSRSRLFKKLLEWSVTPKPKPAALKQLLFLPLIPFEESLLRSFALEPSASLPPASMAALQDLVCIRLIQAGRYTEAIKTDHEFTASTTTLLKGLTTERSKMIQELYTTLPTAERLLLDEELKQTNKQLPPSPPSPRNMSTSWPGDLSASSSWEDVRKMLSPSPHGKRAHMKVLGRDTQVSPKSIVERSQAPRFGGPLPKKPLADIHLPLIPTSNAPPKPAQRKSFPLPQIPATKPPAKSAVHPPTISTLDVSKGPPPAKRSPERHVSPQNGLQGTAPLFSSASRNKNAFYQPPPLPKGLGVAPAENHVVEPEVPVAGPSNKDVDANMEDMNVEENQDTANPPELEFSIFGDTSQEVGLSVINGFGAVSDPEKKKRNVPPGAFLLDEEDGMEDEDTWGKTAGAPSRRGVKQHPVVVKNEDKPVSPVEKKSARPRYSTTREVEQLKRSLPGALMDDEEEEEDHVAPLKQPSPPRRLRKGRSSTSSDLGDELEAPQTRRRSSRLSSQVNVTVPDESPKKASASARTKKSTKSTASSTKKKR